MPSQARAAGRARAARRAARRRRAAHFARKRLAAFIFMVFGMFMAILDIQIVSASLSQIQAGLSASSDEITWVQTSYLIAEVVMIPLSGFLSRVVSTRVIFTISAGGFTLMSFMCAQANSIEEMILWRALQGFIGGGMIPTVFASAFTIFPRSKQPLIGPIIGLVATLAPTIGPTVGGYLTDLFSWHWLFLVNIVPGIIVTAAAWLLIDFDEPDWSLLTHFDYFGLVTMAGFLGALEYALEEGPSKDWFESGPVTAAIVISATSAVAVLLAHVHREAADRRSHHLPRPQLLDRHDVRLRARHRALRPHLYLSGLSGGGARLFVADDRQDDVRHRRLHVPHRAPRRAADDPGRSARDDRGRVHLFRRRAPTRPPSSPSTGISGSCCGRRSSAASG